MFEVFIINKTTGQPVKTIADHLTEARAQSICEEWGWNYCDEKGVSYWIDYAAMSE